MIGQKQEDEKRLDENRLDEKWVYHKGYMHLCNYRVISVVLAVSNIIQPKNLSEKVFPLI